MNDWQRVPTRRVFHVVQGGTPTADEQNWNGDIPWATPVDLALRHGGVLDSTSRSLTDTGLRTGSRSVPADSLILSTRAPIGYVVQNRMRTALNQGCKALVPRSQMDIRYFRYQFLASAPALAGIGQGATFVELSGDALKDFPVVVPPLHTQRAIADFLDRETAGIDAVIRMRQGQIRLLKTKWRAAVQLRVHELSQLSGTVPLKRLVQCLDGRRVPLSAEERQQRQGIFPYYGASGVIDHINDWIFDEELVLLGEDGAQLGDPTYDISFVVRGQCWVNNHAHVLRPALADAEFLALHLSTLDRFAFMSGATREKITQDDMNRIPVPNLSVEEQKQESERLSQSRQKATALRNHLDRQVELLQERRRGLITAAASGQMETPSAA